MEAARADQVLVVGIGGTIAMERTKQGGGVQPVLTGESLVAAVPELRDLVPIAVETFLNLPSAHLSIEVIGQLVTFLQERGGHRGVVVTTGTDVLEELAFGIDLMWPRVEPVVVTGAMRNASLPGADGPANLLAAVQTASDPQSRGLGCLVVLNDEIHGARYVSKAHASSLSAFVSMGLGRLGCVVEGVPHLLLRPMTEAQRLSGPPTAPARIATIRLGIGDEAGLLEDLPLERWDGIVLEALGGGHGPPKVADAVERVVAAGKPVVLASRTGAGVVLRQTYGFVGSETDLLSRGAWSAGLLNGAKARVLLAYLLPRFPDGPTSADCALEFARLSGASG